MIHLLRHQQKIVDKLYNDIVENGKLTNYTIFIARLPGKTTIIKELSNKLQMRYANTTNTRPNRDRL